LDFSHANMRFIATNSEAFTAQKDSGVGENIVAATSYHFARRSIKLSPLNYNALLMKYVILWRKDALAVSSFSEMYIKLYG